MNHFAVPHVARAPSVEAELPQGPLLTTCAPNLPEDKARLLVRRVWRRERDLRSRLRAAEQELWRRQAMFAQTERMARVGGWSTDLATNEMFWSDEIYHISELPVGKTVSVERALSFYPPEARRQLAQAIIKTMTDHVPFDLQLPYVTAKGSHRWVWSMGQVEVIDGRPSRVFGIFQDITAQKDAEERLWRVANHDALTGLANRMLLRDRLDRALASARRRNARFGLLIVDLDGFKDVNDTYGHDTGDHVLRIQADRLRAAVRNIDSVARLGGDEFAVLLPDLVERSDALVPAHRIVAALRSPIPWRNTDLECRCSIGIAVFPDDGAEQEELTKAADLALYQAKQDGRNGCKLFTPVIRAERERWLGALDVARQALRDDQVVPFYQPVIDLRSGRVSGFEALLRRRTPDGVVEGPGGIAAAFDDGEIGCAIGDRMRERVLRDRRTWRADGSAYGRVGLNLSEPEFRRGGLAARVLSSLADAGIAMGELVLEVTENALLKRTASNAMAALEALKDAGVHIALDDFGTGASSLVHLQRFPVNAIKIDRSFIDKVLLDARSAAIVEAIIGLSGRLGFDLIAEGVETGDQLAFLRGAGCARAQGFLFARAMPAAELPVFLERWPERWLGMAGGVGPALQSPQSGRERACGYDSTGLAGSATYDADRR